MSAPAMKQLTRDEAIAFHDEGKWQAMSARDRAFFQMAQDCLCMPFEKFHEAVQEVLGRPVWTHEFANRERLMAELTRDAPAPTFAEILGMLPMDKTVVITKADPA